VEENGFIKIYLANESSTNVYFDALDIAHHKSQIIQESHYYPYGLTFQVHNRPDETKNRIRFQGQERVELTGWDQFKWRNHQPELGRFFNIDPLSEEYVHNATYAFSENHVTSGIELEGLEDVRLNLEQDRDVNDYLSGKITAQQKREREVARVQGAASGLAVGSLFVGGATVGAPRLAAAVRTGWNWLRGNPEKSTIIAEQSLEFLAGMIAPDMPDLNPVSLSDNAGRALGKGAKEITEKYISKYGAKEVSSHLKKSGFDADQIKSLTGLDLLSSSHRNAISGLEKQIDGHTQKLKEFIANPDAFDNKGFLKTVSPEMREKIINSRIRSLQHQINNFKQQIHDIKTFKKEVLKKQ